MYSIVGWISVGLLAILAMPFILIRANKYLLKTRDKKFFQAVKFLRVLHKPLGILFLITALYHGYLVLGRIKLHTGTVLYASILCTAIAGGIFYKTKNTKALKLHRAAAGISAILLLIHYFKPYAFS